MKKLFGLFFTALALFTGCDGSISVTAYVQDLLALKSSATPLATTATVIAEGLTKPEEIEYLKSIFPDLTNEHIVKSSYADAYAFDIKVPLIRNDSAVTDEMKNALMYLIVQKTDDGYSMSCHYNQTKIDEVKEWVYKTYMQTFDLKEYKLDISVVNDTRNDFSLTSNSVYVNDKAYPFSYSTTLGKRDTVLLKVSEIMNSAMIDDQDTTFPVLFFK